MPDGQDKMRRSTTEDDITATVLARFAATPDPRLRQIMLGLIKHLHEFVKEVELTETEWFQAIEILTEAGKMCSDKRQEFILFSDTLGVSMVVNLIGHRKPEGASESTVFGPFHRLNAPENAGGRQHRPSRHGRGAGAGQRPGVRPRRQADRRRRTRRVAGADQRPLQFAGQQPRQFAHARQVSQRWRRPLFAAHGDPGQLPDTLGRAGRGEC